MSNTNERHDSSALREELEDRLADLALAEVLGGQRPPDLSHAIALASKQPLRSWRTAPKLTLAASVLIAIGAGAYAWRLSQSSGKQVSLIDGKFDSVSSVSSSVGRPYAQKIGSKYSAADDAGYTPPATYFAPSRRTNAPTSGEPAIAYPDREFWVSLTERRKQLSDNAWGNRDLRDRDHGPGAGVGLDQQGEFSADLDIPFQQGSFPLGTPQFGGFVPRTVDQGRGPGQAGDRYSRIVENPFLKVTDNPLSTFSIDVDTASYAKVRRYLMQNGVMPPLDAVRIEEFVNYFHYEYAPPKDEKPFAAHVEVAACPWAEKHRLVRIGLKGREIAREARPPSNLVFLLDVSGSMEPDDKLPRVRRSMRMLVEQLGENDRVAIVVYASATGLVLPSTPGYRQEEILTALENLHAGGSTNGGAGIRLAYDLAATHFIKGGTNRVILCTDGDFNVGTTSDGELERLAEEKARTGVFLTVLGFGMGNHNDVMLERIADKGNGNYGYIDTEEEARKLLVEELSGTLVTIAKDVKIQIEFNPQTVGAYRLLGYENRLLRAEDFNDDTKDAGEIGAGHTVTALYEIVPAGEKLDTPPMDPLRYQQLMRPADAATSGELLTLRLRYKEPDGQESKAPLVFPVSDRGSQFGQATKDFKFAAAVAGFAMLLRDSQYRGSLTYDAVLEIGQEGRGEDRHGYRAAFLEVARRAKSIAGR